MSLTTWLKRSTRSIDSVANGLVRHPRFTALLGHAGAERVFEALLRAVCRPAVTRSFVRFSFRGRITFALHVALLLNQQSHHDTNPRRLSESLDALAIETG